MLLQLLEVFQTVAIPFALIATILLGCGGDSRPKKEQHSKSRSKEHHSGKGHSRSGKSSKRKEKRRSSRGQSSKSGKRKSKSKRKDKGKSGTSSSMSAKSSQSSKNRSFSKKGAKDPSSKSACRRSTSASRHSSKKMKKRADLIKLPDEKRSACEEVVDTSGISRPIGSEPQKDMIMEPTELRWSTTGGMQKVFLTNPTEERRAIKVKCSDNNLYRVNPVFSFIEPGQSLGIDIVRQNGGAKIDKMVFITAKAKPEDVRPRELFHPSVANRMMVLPLIAT